MFMNRFERQMKPRNQNDTLAKSWPQNRFSCTFLGKQNSENPLTKTIQTTLQIFSPNKPTSKKNSKKNSQVKKQHESLSWQYQRKKEQHSPSIFHHHLTENTQNISGFPNKNRKKIPTTVPQNFEVTLLKFWPRRKEKYQENKGVNNIEPKLKASKGIWHTHKPWR